MSQPQKSETNIWWYILLSFMLVLFVSAIQIYSTSLLGNPDVDLSNETIEYILSINNIDVSEFNVTASQIEELQADPTNNETGSQSKDFALEFFYARAQTSKLENIIKNVFSFPEFVATLLRIPFGAIAWIIGILNWFWRIGMLVAVYYFIRGVVT